MTIKTPHGQVRDSVINLLKQHPEGLELKKIHRLLNIKNKINLSHYTRQGYIRSEKVVGQHKRIFYLNNDAEKILLDYIKTHPGQTAAELSLRLPGDVAEIIGKLKQSGKISVRKLDQNRYYVEDTHEPEPAPEVPTGDLPNWFGPTLQRIDPPPTLNPIGETTVTEHPMVGTTVNCEVCNEPFNIEKVNIKTRHYYCANHVPGGEISTLRAKQANGPTVVQLAKDYFWETGSDSLKEFIAWYKEKTK